MSALAEQVGQIFENARGTKSRRALAREAECANTSLLEIEKGRGNPTLERLETLAEVYGVELSFKAKRRPKGKAR